jgi:hypothetical protein
MARAGLSPALVTDAKWDPHLLGNLSHLPSNKNQRGFQTIDKRSLYLGIKVCTWVLKFVPGH